MTLEQAETLDRAVEGTALVLPLALLVAVYAGWPWILRMMRRNKHGR